MIRRFTPHSPALETPFPHLRLRFKYLGKTFDQTGDLIQGVHHLPRGVDHFLKIDRSILVFKGIQQERKSRRPAGNWGKDARKNRRLGKRIPLNRIGEGRIPLSVCGLGRVSSGKIFRRHPAG